MRIAFYSPIKAPDHPQPSGDRRIARLLIAALGHAGHEVVLASRLRTWDAGDPQRQHRLRRLGGRCADRLYRQWSTQPEHKPALWFSYHPYHKAPDWLGLDLSRRLGIPYVLAEVSFAPKQASGRWAEGHQAVADALRSAHAVVSLNPDDLLCVRRQMAADARLVELAPFLDPPPAPAAGERTQTRLDLARELGLTPDRPWLVTVAMMRDDIKLASYRLLAEACRRMQAQPWQLLIIGDGVARAQVEQAFAGLQSQVRFLGLRTDAALQRCLAACDLFVWPALGEALGMAVLEAQAAGLPVVVGDRPGTRQLVTSGQTGYLVREHSVEALTSTLDRLLSDAGQLPLMGQRARLKIDRSHSLPSASRALDSLLRKLQNPAR